MDRIAVVYDVGAATPTEIIESLSGMAEPIFVLPESEHVKELAEVLAEIVTVTTFDDIAEYEPRGVVTFSDYQLERAAELADTLRLTFHSPAAAHDLTRKFRQRSILNEHGVAPVSTALLTDILTATEAAERVPLPGVVKPNRGFGGTDTYLVESKSELLTLAERLFESGPVTSDDGYVVETLIVGADIEPPWGNYVSVESMVCDGEVEHLAITGKLALKPPFREQGSYLPARTATFDEDAVLELTGAALTALEVGNSICHTEIKLTADGPRIIEVNGRLGHPIHDLFKRAHGVDLIQAATRLAMGAKPSIELDQCRDVVYHYFGLSPVGVDKLVSMPGLDRLRSRPEVDQFALLIRPPAALDWRRGFQERIYTCTGRVPDHAALAAFTSTIEEILAVRFG